MKKVWEFFQYCFKCLVDGISAGIGHVPDGFGWKEVLVAILTMLVIFIIIFLLLWLFGFIKFRK